MALIVGGPENPLFVADRRLMYRAPFVRAGLNKGCATNECREKALAYGIVQIPAVAVNGRLIDHNANQRSITREDLAAAGIGQG